MYTKLTLEISHAAEKDLQGIWRRNADSSHQAAGQITQKLAHKIFTLEYLAHQYPEVPESERFGLPYRQLDCDKYQVLFQVDKKHVQVLRIL